MFNLNELQHDALVEIFNIGVGQAAKAMSEIVNEPVTMSVPSITFLNRADAAAMLGKKETSRVCGVSQHYQGAFSTEAILMFPEDKSLDIVRLMVGESVPLKELTDMEQEAMSEIGNIILNSCVGTLANILCQELRGSLPEYHVGTSDQILRASGADSDTVVLMLHIDFILDLTALHDLQDQLDIYLAKAMGTA